MTKNGMLNDCCINNTNMNVFKNCHPKQIITDTIPVPVWQVSYSYTTNRGNYKTADKYIIKDESAWDSIEKEFNLYMEQENEEHPERKISNVEILDVEFLGEAEIELE